MKYLKTYESLDEPIYFWKLKVANPYLEYGLIKLGASKTQIRNMLNNINFYKDEYIYVAPTANNGKDENFLSWNYCTISGYNDYINRNYIFKGELEVSLDDIDAYKNQNKYNL